MTTVGGGTRRVPQTATREYETLRANALGDINKAAGYTLFLQNGMAAWFGGLERQAAGCIKPRKEISPVFAEPDMSLPEASLAAILADAILKSVTIIECRR